MSSQLPNCHDYGMNMVEVIYLSYKYDWAIEEILFDPREIESLRILDRQTSHVADNILNPST